MTLFSCISAVLTKRHGEEAVTPARRIGFLSWITYRDISRSLPTRDSSRFVMFMVSNAAYHDSGALRMHQYNWNIFLCCATTYERETFVLSAFRIKVCRNLYARLSSSSVCSSSRKFELQWNFWKSYASPLQYVNCFVQVNNTDVSFHKCFLESVWCWQTILKRPLLRACQHLPSACALVRKYVRLKWKLCKS